MKISRNIRTKLKGYMTIEASFIVPLTVMICIMIILASFYLYNNCVVYQDCFIAALRGSQIMDASQAEVSTKVHEYASELLENQVYQYSNDPQVDVGMLTVKVKASSHIDIPVSGITLYEGSSFGNTSEAECMRLDPTEIVRLKY